LTDELVRLGTRKLVQELLEQELTEQIGCERYVRDPERRRGRRNGYKERRLRISGGRLPIAVPQVRGRAEPFRSALWPALSAGSELVRQAAMRMYVKGLSTRDVEEVLTLLSGDGEALLSRTGVSQVTDALWEEFERFSARDLSELPVMYLFADAVYESLRKQAGAAEGILVTWGILLDGSKVLIHLSLGNKESAEAWLDHFRDLVRRGLPTPLTVTTDGAPGLIRAVETIWPQAERIRCWMHKMQNLLAKVPETMRDELRAWLAAVRDAPDYQAGKEVAAHLIARYQQEYPSAMKSFTEDLEASLAHLKLPAAHRKHIRTTNLLERAFGEQRRRTKVIPRFFHERDCLKLVFGVLLETSQRWRRVTFSEHDQKQLEAYIEGRRPQLENANEVAA
jgi:transposase-like protein